MFQLTTSRRGRLTKKEHALLVKRFNSRPHEEVDVWIQTSWDRKKVSTHDLTKRSTDKIEDTMGLTSFQLTTSRRGRQSLKTTKELRRKFQLTTSRRGRRYTPPEIYEAILFQLTTSRRGRPLLCSLHFLRNFVSTHDLTKRSTTYQTRSWKTLSVSTHDLTKRSTELILLMFCSEIRFNSRPHEEVDQQLPGPINPYSIVSTHDLTKRSTCT